MDKPTNIRNMSVIAHGEQDPVDDRILILFKLLTQSITESPPSPTPSSQKAGIIASVRY
jgi:hypothetical protein